MTVKKSMREYILVKNLIIVGSVIRNLFKITIKQCMSELTQVINLTMLVGFAQKSLLSFTIERSMRKFIIRQSYKGFQKKFQNQFLTLSKIHVTK